MSGFKFNWGHGIVLTLGLFIAAMGYTIYLTFQNDYVLESENYYEEELNYDATIAAKKLGQQVDAKLDWSLDKKGNVTLRFDLIPTEVNCILKHPQWEEQDRKVRITQEENVVVCHFGDAEPAHLNWRLELSMKMGPADVLIQKRWNY